MERNLRGVAWWLRNTGAGWDDASWDWWDGETSGWWWGWDDGDDGRSHGRNAGGVGDDGGAWLFLWRRKNGGVGWVWGLFSWDLWDVGWDNTGAGWDDAGADRAGWADADDLGLDDGGLGRAVDDVGSAVGHGDILGGVAGWQFGDTGDGWDWRSWRNTGAAVDWRGDSGGGVAGAVWDVRATVGDGDLLGRVLGVLVATLVARLISWEGDGSTGKESDGDS